MNKIPKNRSKYSLLAMVIFIIILVIGLVSFFMFRREEKSVIKIGAILPVSGPAEEIGIEGRDGMLLALDKINARKGINGRKIKLIIGDSKSDPQEGIKTFNMIEKEHHPLLYVSILSSVSVALMPSAEENSVVLVGLAVSTTNFPKGGKWIFRYYTNTVIEAQAILSMFRELNIQKLGIIYLNDEYGRSVFEHVMKGLNVNGKIIRTEFYDPVVFDYKEQIAKLKDMDAICFIGFVQHINAAFRQFKEMNYEGAIVGSIGGSTPSITNKPEANGIYVVAPMIYDSNYIFSREAKKQYEARYNKLFTVFAANSYDFFMFIAGLLKDKTFSRESVRVALEQGFIYPSVFGVIDVKQGDHNIPFPMYPALIVHGELRYLHLNK